MVKLLLGGIAAVLVLIASSWFAPDNILGAAITVVVMVAVFSLVVWLIEKVQQNKKL